MTTPEARSQRYAARGRVALPVSFMIVRNRIRAGGFKSRVSAKKQTELTQRHRDTRLRLSRAHVGWNNTEWRGMMFSDESKF